MVVAHDSDDEDRVDESVADDAEGNLDVLHGEPEPNVDRSLGDVEDVLNRLHPLFLPKTVLDF